MDDVDLLVNTFYGYMAYYRGEQKKLREKELEDEEAALEAEYPDPATRPKPQQDDLQESSEEEVYEDGVWNFDTDFLVQCLEKFHLDREEQAFLELQNNSTKSKKKSSFENEEEKAARNKRMQLLFWQRLTTILSDQKLSVWKALDKSLAKYYQNLVDRQNLIEETGLLNQQNEELKTLLNQYL